MGRSFHIGRAIVAGSLALVVTVVAAQDTPNASSEHESNRPAATNLTSLNSADLVAQLQHTDPSHRLSAAWEFARRRPANFPLHVEPVDWFLGYATATTAPLPPQGWCLAVNRALLKENGKREALQGHLALETPMSLKPDKASDIVVSTVRYYIEAPWRLNRRNDSIEIADSDGVVVGSVDTQSKVPATNLRRIRVFGTKEGYCTIVTADHLRTPGSLSYRRKSAERNEWETTFKAGTKEHRSPPNPIEQFPRYFGLDVIADVQRVTVFGWSDASLFVEAFELKDGKPGVRFSAD